MKRSVDQRPSIASYQLPLALRRVLLTLLLTLLLLSLTSAATSPDVATDADIAANEGCMWHPWREGDPRIYYINMDGSAARRQAMEGMLLRMGSRFERFRGLTMDNIHVPDDLESTWNTKQARYQTEQLSYASLLSGTDPPYQPAPWGTFHQSLSPPPQQQEQSVAPAGTGEDGDVGASASVDTRLQAVLVGLYGRRRTNRLAELGCTLSHLLAMRRAIYADLRPDGSHSESRYAVIIEDDVSFPFAIDWQGLVKSAPAGFGMLQLFNSNEETMQSTFRNFQEASANPRWREQPEKWKLWHERFPKQPGSFWSTCAYLIDKQVMRPVVDSIISLRILHAQVAATAATAAGQGQVVQGEAVPPEKAALPAVMEARVIAGIKWECTPRHSPCCPDPANYTYSEANPCVQSPRGFQADMYLFATTKAYVLASPLIANGRGGNESTFHQSHVEQVHYNAFQRQRGYINDMLTGRARRPAFATPACYTGEDEGQPRLLAVGGAQMMQLERKAHLCSYRARSTEQVGRRPTVHWLRSSSQASGEGGGGHSLLGHLKEVGLRGSEVPALSFSNLTLSVGAEAAMRGSDKMCEARLAVADTAATAAATSRGSVGLGLGDEFFLRSLCGVAALDSKDPSAAQSEIAASASHLVALYQAAHSDSNSSYALVVPEEARLLFDVSWDALADSVQEHRQGQRQGQGPPRDWALLLLSNPHTPLAKALWWKRVHNSTRWGQWAGADTPANLASALYQSDAYYDTTTATHEEEVQYAEALGRLLYSPLLATGGYLIHKRRMRGLLRGLVDRQPLPLPTGEAAQGAGLGKPRHRYTIDLLASPDLALAKKGALSRPVRYSSGGAAPSSVLLSLAPLQTYVLMYPLVAADMAQLTAGQHDWSTYAERHSQRTFVNNLLEGVARLPRYIQAACGSLLELEPPEGSPGHAAGKGKGKGGKKGKGKGKDRSPA